MKRLLSATAAISVFALGVSAASAAGIVPFIFDPDGLGGASAAKMENMGCDRNQAGNLDKGLVMFKLGATAENKSSGATITGINGKNLCGEAATVGFQYRPQGHCGAGAPRFNITTRDGVNHFVGCAAMTKSAVDEDTGCVTATANVHNAGQAFPIIPTGSGNACIVKSMAIVFDEGTDTPSPGFASIDNININGTIIDPQ